MGKKVKVKFVKVVTGRDEEILHTERGSHVVGIPFRTTKGKVLLEVCYADQRS
jgi:chemotaxis protein CheX